MLFKYLVILYILLFMTIAETFKTRATINNEKSLTAYCEIDKKVNTLLEYLQGIRYNFENKIKRKDREIEKLEQKLKELNKKLEDSNTAHLQDYGSQTDIIKILFDKVSYNNQTANKESDQLAQLRKTIDDQKLIMTNLAMQNYEDKRKLQTCEIQLNQEREIVANDRKDHDTNLHRIKSEHSKEIEKLYSEIEELKAQIVSDSPKLLMYEDSEIPSIENQFSKLESQAYNIAIHLPQSQDRFEELREFSLEGKVDSCIPFADTPGIHKIKVPGMKPFDVLCETAGSGTGPDWIVIQQRINGKENFDRNWTTYQSGFGSFDGDMFLGLEKIYRLTFNRRHELYIHLETFAGEITYATYNNFIIAGGNYDYELVRADGYIGNIVGGDFLQFHVGKKFYTFDYDTPKECAKNYHGGWWYNDDAGCAFTNLNGKYFNHEVEDKTSIFRLGYDSLKKVQMFIRPVIV